MKVLFLMRTPVHTWNFDSVLRTLAERGHDVHVAFETRERKRADDSTHIERVAREHPGITYGEVHPTLRLNPIAAIARRLRAGIDYLSYLDPRYRDADKLRQRAAGFAPRMVRRLAALAPLNSSRGHERMRQCLRAFERAIPTPFGVARFIRSHDPDIVLATPLVMFGTNQVDYLRKAHALGIRTGLCLYSWDSLTNKGVMHEIPGLVTVWNEIQRREAVEIHSVPSSRLVVTGAPSYDHWFESIQATPREQFCRLIGLPADRPIVLFVGSSRFIAPEEARFVRGWVQGLRASSSSLQEAGVLVRPHPLNPCWRGADLSDLDRVAVWPPSGAFPVDNESRKALYDSVHHAAAVVGVNTSAMIDTAIIGRPLFAWLAPEFGGTQAGAPHFHYLTSQEGGPVSVADSFPEHVSQLAEALSGSGTRAHQNGHFVDSFVRPQGVEHPSAPRVVDAIEAAVERPRVSSRAPAQ